MSVRPGENDKKWKVFLITWHGRKSIRDAFQVFHLTLNSCGLSDLAGGSFRFSHYLLSGKVKTIFRRLFISTWAGSWQAKTVSTSPTRVWVVFRLLVRTVKFPQFYCIAQFRALICAQPFNRTPIKTAEDVTEENKHRLLLLPTHHQTSLADGKFLFRPAIAQPNWTCFSASRRANSKEFLNRSRLR